MLRLMSLLFGLVLISSSISVRGQNSSYAGSCGDEIAMTFEDWRQWTQVTPKPVISKGHSNNWVGVYVDDLAKETYLAATGPYAECAKIIKPIYTDSSGAVVRKLTIMVKMPPGYDTEDNDWWYGTYDATGTIAITQGKLTGCIICHRQAANTDYLFSKDVVHAENE